jgi:diaminohydroxyphosphoribosylaminopyrimidine deaminase/5-amino-6-(5-phosphoribosylamino)uracil reductase
VRDDPSLNVRWPELPEAVRELFPEDPGITPLRIIADPDNAITLKEKLFQCPGKVLIARTGSGDTVTEERISDSVSVVKVPARKDNPRHISFWHLWRYLDSISIRNVMIEAGRGLVSDVIRQNAANEIVVYMAPKIMGSDAVPAFGALGLSSMAEVPELVISDVAAVGTDVRITCRFKEGACLPE